MSMRIAAIFLAVLLPSASAGMPAPAASPPEATADSLYDAQAIDSLLAFSQRMLQHAAASGDSTRLGRMTYHRGRARLALRDPGAESDFDHAIGIAGAVGDSVGLMHALGLKAFVAVHQGRLEESIRLNEERVRLARSVRNAGSEAWGHLLIGYAELQRENSSRARTEYEAAWRAFGEVGRPKLQLTALVGLGRTLTRLGRYDEARTSFQHAWLTARELGDLAQEADAINNLGVLEYEHGELALAARYFERTYQLKREAKAFDLANAARNVAVVDLIIGRHAHAESTLTDALPATPTGDMLDATVHIELGRIRLAQGRPRAATTSFRRVIGAGANMPVKNRVEAITFLAEALAALDSIPAAVALMDREFSRLDALGPSVWRAEAYLGWTRALRATGSLDRSLAAAGNAWADATARADSMLAVLAAAEVSLCERALGRDADAYSWLERARSGFETSPRASEFQWREAQRAVLARALIEAGDVLRSYPEERHPAERARALFDFLQQVRSRTLLERVTDPRRVGEIDASLLRPASADELQENLLHDGECYLDATVGAGHIYLFVATGRNLELAVIEDPAGAIQARLHAYSRTLARPPRKSGQSGPDEAARALGDALFAGVAPALRASSRVFASLDGPLSGLPIETLVCPDEDRPLIERREVERIPAAAFLRFQRERRALAPATSSVVAIAPEAGNLPGAEREVRHLVRSYRAHRLDEHAREAVLDGLEGHDVIHLASHVRIDSQRPWNSGVWIGAAGASGEADPARHGSEAHTADPLALTPGDSSLLAVALPHDPYLRASEIASRRLDARLVVLSGCESALGRATLAEGVLGLSSSFLAAGARAVVASLWEVDDQTTAEFMTGFYRGLSHGETVAAALRSAQLAMRERRPHPFYWAGFVVIGEGVVGVRLTAHRDWPARPALLVAGTVTVLLICGWVIGRRRARMAV